MSQRRVKRQDQAAGLAWRKIVWGRECINKGSELRDGGLGERRERILRDSFEGVPRLAGVLRREYEFANLLYERGCLLSDLFRAVDSKERTEWVNKARLEATPEWRVERISGVWGYWRRDSNDAEVGMCGYKKLSLLGRHCASAF